MHNYSTNAANVLSSDRHERHETQIPSFGSTFNRVLYYDVTRYDAEQIHTDEELIWRSSLFHRAPVSGVIYAAWRSNCLWIKMFGV